jgi:multiple antibiotic resistance protein
MIEFLKPYLLSFISMFVAVNAIGILPMFISLTEDMPATERRKTIYTSVLTAAILALIFLFLGKAILLVMGITVSDFKVAGGILLAVISVNSLLPRESEHHGAYTDVGAFPLGTPLITGPAVLTTLLVLSGSHGFIPTIVSLILNMAIVLLIFRGADLLTRVMGKAGMKASAKIAYILLASIAVKMIRNGIAEIAKSGWLQ